VTTARRSPALPEVPTIAEAGVLGYEFAGWMGVLAPSELQALSSRGYTATYPG
jgi:tripartite-type tricarboxylate transporter receptor subunit TctC